MGCVLSRDVGWLGRGFAAGNRQTYFYDQSAGAGIRGAYAAPVQLDGALGDGEAQAYSSRVLRPRGIEAVEGAEEVFELRVGDSRRTRITTSMGGVELVRSAPTSTIVPSAV